MEEDQKAPPKFELGDLVKIKNLGLLFAAYEGVQAEYGLINCEAYCYKSNTTSGILIFGWWTYDVLIDGKLIKMMPETFLEIAELSEVGEEKERPREDN